MKCRLTALWRAAATGYPGASGNRSYSGTPADDAPAIRDKGRVVALKAPGEKRFTRGCWHWSEGGRLRGIRRGEGESQACLLTSRNLKRPQSNPERWMSTAPGNLPESARHFREPGCGYSASPRRWQRT